jgi:hypothetical protein
MDGGAKQQQYRFVLQTTAHYNQPIEWNHIILNGLKARLEVNYEAPFLRCSIALKAQ